MPRTSDLKTRSIELSARRERLSTPDGKAFDTYMAEIRKELQERRWISSARTERLWALLHDAEEELDRHDTDAEYLFNEAMAHGRADLDGQFKPLANAERAGLHDKLVWARKVIQEAHEAADVRHLSERNESRGVYVFSLAFCLALLALIVAQMLVGSVSLVPLPRTVQWPGFPLSRWSCCVVRSAV